MTLNSMNKNKSLKRLTSLLWCFLFIGSVCQLSFASGSYAPPKARGVNSAKVELYHLGKRLTLKRIAPTKADAVAEVILTEQTVKLKSLSAKIQKKHLKALNLEHLYRLQPKEFKAIIVYLTTRYGIADQ